MKKSMIYSILFACMAAFAACGDDEVGSANPAGEVSCSPTELNFIANGGEQTVTVTANREWMAYASADWMTLTPTHSIGKTGTLTVKVAENGTYDDREGTVTVKVGNTRQVIAVRQPGIPKPAPDPSMNVPEGYEIDWYDEFTGISLGSDWTYEVKDAGWVNSEKQAYVNGNGVTEVSNGTLKINCKKVDGKIYSARLYANKKKGWKYGWVEAKIKLPKGSGTWPAFWMMPVDESDGWPTCGEIDIMEEVGNHPDYTSRRLSGSQPVPRAISTYMLWSGRRTTSRPMSMAIRCCTSTTTVPATSRHGRLPRSFTSFSTSHGEAPGAVPAALTRARCPSPWRWTM